jgi:hypothetical protein
LRYESLHHVAKRIDHLIDHHLPKERSAFLPQEDLKKLVEKNFPDYFVENCGWHKIIFGNRSIDHKIVLKVGTKKSIENDHRAYKRLPHRLRHRLFARIFWHTKYCLLQEYGFPMQVTPEQLAEIRQEVYKYGIFDVKADNLRKIDGAIKIIDANVTRIPIPTVLRKIDEIKARLPKRLDTYIKKLTKKISD